MNQNSISNKVNDIKTKKISCTILRDGIQNLVDPYLVLQLHTYSPGYKLLINMQFCGNLDYLHVASLIYFPQSTAVVS